MDPASAAANFKRDIGTQRHRRIRDIQYSPIELSAYVLDALRQDAARVFGEPPSHCVVTVPAYFNDAQRYATKQAAELAGFVTERVLNEPTAAAIAHGLHHAKSESTFLVFDLGGGTFDVCVMELFEGLLEVKSVSGVSQLGGEDFTSALARLILEKAHGGAVTFDALNAGERIRLHKNAELLKRRLSRWDCSEVALGEISSVRRPDVTLKISAREADDAYAPLLARMLEPCRTALRGAGIQATDLDEVILVGGATRMPAVQALAERVFERKPLIDPDPDLLVVRGAAAQAGLYEAQTPLGDIVVTDVCSHSLGISIARTMGRKHISGYFSPVIHRNTVIPTSRTEAYNTLSPDQSDVLFRNAPAIPMDGFVGPRTR